MSEVKKYKFHQIHLTVEPKVVRVHNYEPLHEYLCSTDKGARRLAAKLKKAYKEQQGDSLKISTRSLATEIRGHYRIKRICCWFDKTFPCIANIRPIRCFLDSMIAHMDVIDCGERDCDNNRWVWDILQIFCRK